VADAKRSRIEVSYWAAVMAIVVVMAVVLCSWVEEISLLLPTDSWQRIKVLGGITLILEAANAGVFVWHYRRGLQMMRDRISTFIGSAGGAWDMVCDEDPEFARGVHVFLGLEEDS